MELKTLKPTKWSFYGLFFCGDMDEAGTPIGDMCSGYFVTETDDEQVAKAALVKRYEHLAGRFSLRDLKKLDFDGGKDAARIFKRGGTKQVPILR